MADRYRYIAERLPRASSKGRDTEHRLIMEAAIARRADKAVALLSRHFDTTALLCQNELRRRKTAKGRRQGMSGCWRVYAASSSGSRT